MVLSVLLHLGLLFLLLWVREQQVSYMDSAAPIQSPQPEESMPVILEESQVTERLEEKRDQMALQQQKVIGLKRKESAELQALREEAEKERLRLEKLRQQAEEEKRLAAEREKRLEEERKAAAEKKRREQEQQRLAEEKRKKEEAEKKQLAEQKRKQEEAEKKRLADEQRKKEEAERREQELAEEARASSTSGAAARQSGEALSANQKRDGTGTGGTGRMSGGGGGKEYDKYIGMIRSKITRNWRRPPGTPSGLQVTLKVKLFPGGGVADVRVARSSGDPAYDSSAQEALQAADPLPVPSGKAFDRFRTLNLKFSPTGIQ
jgi:colicin import membrane protein